MRWVDQATTRPFRCAVLPYVGNGRGNAFLDTGQDLDLEHVYISDVACEAIAEAIGWVSPAEVFAERQRTRTLEQELAEAREELEELREFKGSVDGLARHGLGVKKLPGRKPKRDEEGVAA